jgi:hypothetical protein
MNQPGKKSIISDKRLFSLEQLRGSPGWIVSSAKLKRAYEFK